MHIISERFWNQNQSWHYERVVQQDKLKLRVKICRNAYDHQSWLRGYAFDPTHLAWNLLVDRPIYNAYCKEAKYFNPTERMQPFQMDAESILEELCAIIYYN